MNKESSLSRPEMYPAYPYPEDEVDLSELFDRIWLRRRFIIALVFVAVVVVSGLSALALFIDAPEHRYSSIIQFSFPDAEKGLYPGGQKFAYNDLVSAKVLDTVYRQNGLKDKGVSFDDFIAAISINPFAENAEFIKKKYQSLLADKKLTRPEVEAMENSFLQELKASQSRFVRLSYLESSLKGIDTALAQKILQDIPRVWSKYAIEELGVLDLKVAGADFYQPQKIERFEYLQILGYLQNSADVLAGVLNELVRDEIGGLVRNSQSGITASDLQVQLKNLVDFELEPLFSTVTNLGITKSPDKALIYLQNTILSLADKKAVLMNKSENFARIINQYTGMETPKQTLKQEGANGGFAQYDSTFLDKFTALIEEKSDKAYMQKMLDERLKVLQQIEEISGQIVKFERAEERLRSSVEVMTSAIRADVIKDIELAREGFETLVHEYKQLLEIRNQQVLGDSDVLYELTSDDVLVESNLVGKLKRLVIFTALAGFLGLMLAVLISLVRKLPTRGGSAPEATAS
jgi:hypothetical protein